MTADGEAPGRRHPIAAHIARPEWGIAANVMSDRAFRHGAKVTIVPHSLTSGDGGRRLLAIGLTKHGRVVEKRIATKRLESFRPVWIKEPDRAALGRFWTKDEAAAKATELTGRWSGARSFHRDGRLLHEGVPEGQIEWPR